MFVWGVRVLRDGNWSDTAVWLWWWVLLNPWHMAFSKPRLCVASFHSIIISEAELRFHHYCLFVRVWALQLLSICFFPDTSYVSDTGNMQISTHLLLSRHYPHLPLKSSICKSPLWVFVCVSGFRFHQSQRIYYYPTNNHIFSFVCFR